MKPNDKKGLRYSLPCVEGSTHFALNDIATRFEINYRNTLKHFYDLYNKDQGTVKKPLNYWTTMKDFYELKPTPKKGGI